MARKSETLRYMPFLCRDSQDVQKRGCVSAASDIQGEYGKRLKHTFATSGESGIGANFPQQRCYEDISSSKHRTYIISSDINEMISRFGFPLDVRLYLHFLHITH